MSDSVLHNKYAPLSLLLKHRVQTVIKSTSIKDFPYFYIYLNTLKHKINGNLFLFVNNNIVLNNIFFTS